jgi:AraC-like DNA-binding protein
MRPIPLISAARVAGAANLADAVGVPADRFLDCAGISLRIREDPVGFVSGRSVWAFIGELSRQEGLRDLCIAVARLGDWRRAGWVRPLAHAATLGDAIQAMCSSYVREIPMIRLGLDVKGRVAWFWRRRVTDVSGWDGNEPAEQYMLSFMLEVIRTAAGSDWLPERLKLESSRGGWGADTSALPGVRIEYGHPMLAVAIPAPLLLLPSSIEVHPAAAREGGLPPADLQGSLREVLRSWTPSLRVNQDCAAQILGMSPRTLRRRLAEEGTTWRALVENLTFARATVRLREGRASVREVAEELGYSDTAHFTRFFRRRAGVPPSAYRAEVERATELIHRPLV